MKKTKKGWQHTPKELEQMSASQRGRTATPEEVEKNRSGHVGKTASEETKAKMRESHRKHLETHPATMKGRHHSEETKARMRAAHEARSAKGIPGPNLGKRASEETKAKMVAARRAYLIQHAGPNLGREWGDDYKAKMAEAVKRAHEAKPKAWIEATIKNSKRRETPEERKLHEILRRLGLAFEAHYPVLDRFVVDVYLEQFNLILEADGYWHTTERVKIHDEARDRAIRESGFQIVRIPNEEIGKRAVQQIIRKVRLGGKPSP